MEETFGMVVIFLLLRESVAKWNRYVRAIRAVLSAVLAPAAVISAALDEPSFAAEPGCMPTRDRQAVTAAAAAPQSPHELGGTQRESRNSDSADFDGRTVKADSLTAIVPEPATLVLVALGGMILIGRRRRRGD